ncbi:MAG: hypothetical protein ACM337_00075 [Syntrophaceae bacterium]
MNEYSQTAGNGAGKADYKKTTFFGTKAYSLYHLPLSYSFVEGINDALLHE